MLCHSAPFYDRMGVGGGVVPVLSTRHVVEEERGSPARKAVAGVARKQDAKHMHTRVVVVTQLQQAEGVLQKIREMYGPEMMWVRVREERIKPDFPLEIQVKEGNEAQYHVSCHEAQSSKQEIPFLREIQL
jgi:hypothetical protein